MSLPQPARPHTRRVAVALMIAGAAGAVALGAVAFASTRSGSGPAPAPGSGPSPGGASGSSAVVFGTPPPPLALKPRLADGSVLAQIRLGSGAPPIQVIEGLSSTSAGIEHDAHSAYPGEPHTMLLVAGPGVAVEPPPAGTVVQVSTAYGVYQYRVSSDIPFASAAAAPDAPELRLTVSGSRGATVVTATLVPGDPQSAAEIAEEVSVAQAEQSALSAGVAAAAPGVLHAPLTGPVSQEFGPTNLGIEFPFVYQGVYYAHFHTGLDIAVPLGTPVRAAGDGVVVLATTNIANGVPVGFGTYVVVSHGGGLYTLYGHLARLNVNVGEHVAAGDLLGLSGSTGNSTGPHLHFEVRQGNTPIDPRSILVG